jgi:hypothetical protein
MIVSISGSEIHACGARQETNVTSSSGCENARAIVGAFVKKNIDCKGAQLFQDATNTHIYCFIAFASSIHNKIQGFDYSDPKMCVCVCVCENLPNQSGKEKICTYI